MAVADIEQVTIETDVLIGKGGAKDLLADIYRPPAALSKHTAVIHFHGGGFRGGTKAGARLARPLAAMGYTCVSSSYRLMSEGQWPAQIEDVKACIRWVRANAGQLGVEPHKIAIQGYSAGAHLALVAAGSSAVSAFEGEGGNQGVSTELAACIAFYPPASMSDQHPLLSAGLSPDVARGFSPINLVKAGFPPTMLLHGTLDQTLAVDNSVRIYQAMREANVPVELHVIEGVTHIFDTHPEFAAASATWIDLFLDRHVVNPRTIPSTEPGPR